MKKATLFLLLALACSSAAFAQARLGPGSRILIGPTAAIEFAPPPPPPGPPRDGLIFEGLAANASDTGDGPFWIDSSGYETVTALTRYSDHRPTLSESGVISFYSADSAPNGTSQEIIINWSDTVLERAGTIALRCRRTDSYSWAYIADSNTSSSLWSIAVEGTTDVWLSGNPYAYYTTGGSAAFPTATATVVWAFDCYGGEGGTATGAFYIDGVPIPVTQDAYVPSYNGRSSICIGGGAAGDYGACVSIEWLRIYNRMLTATEATLFP